MWWPLTELSENNPSKACLHSDYLAVKQIQYLIGPEWSAYMESLLWVERPCQNIRKLICGFCKQWSLKRTTVEDKINATCCSGSKGQSGMWYPLKQMQLSRSWTASWGGTLGNELTIWLFPGYSSPTSLGMTLCKLQQLVFSCHKAFSQLL